MQCEGFDDSPVFVFGDGPRNETERFSVEATREIAHELLGARAYYRFSDVNRGLSASIISGIDEVLQVHDRVIVIEDDLVLDKWFLKFMNEALDTYANMENVFQISGYMFNAQEIEHEGTCIFLPFTTSWGWATWRRAWKIFDAAALGWEKLKTDTELRRRFNLGNAYDYATMLERQMSGKADSWAVRWYWSVFNENGLVLFPPVSLVRNAGFDGSGTHGRGLLRRFHNKAGLKTFMYPHFPESAQLDPVFFDKVIETIQLQNGGWKAKLLDALRRLLRL